MHQVTCIGIDVLRRLILFECSFCDWTGVADPVSGRAQGVDRQHSIIYGPDLLRPHEWQALGVEPMPGIELDVRMGARVETEEER